MNQPTLFNLETFTTYTPIYDPAWDEIETLPQKTHSVGGQIKESDFPYKIVGEQDSFDTLKSAPQHDTHWVERYWVERCTNKYWYYRYCWMEGRKIRRRYLGSVRSSKANELREMVESAIGEGRSPVEIEQLIRQQRGQVSQVRSHL